ncbi:hypothetical protein Aab01nite_67140 [Paractinoplanes abujensis]|uniref:Uncharacterized protein n=1 Tax=Paractinoplanes abujensis TaxID=882441 RepID=A0A7W7CYW4_9ACTN|nr:hypothetical protein [Actinoplanes abujensis]MBB4695541.1 hypothetical protein [Actinoplanes abujensis]GID23124.1 hypothetical protein Aab01nite_67140 [Actinoplanes abujensis]
MLSDRDRTLLAPHVALLRRARRDLAAAEAELAEAERDQAESTTHTDWRDRLFGGVLSVDEGRAQQYRRSRKTRNVAAKARDEARAQYEKYAERVDSLLEPMLLEDDAGYRARVDAVRACDKALKACEDMRFRIVSTQAEPAQTPKQDWHEAEFGRQRLAEVVAALREDAQRVRRLIERAGMDVPAPDTTGLRTAGPLAEQSIRGLQRQLDVLIKEVTEWRAAAHRNRITALRAAHESL